MIKKINFKTFSIKHKNNEIKSTKYSKTLKLVYYS